MAEHTFYLETSVISYLTARPSRDGVPAREPQDAAHIALATLHKFRYLATWNFAHFVGPDAKFRVFAALHDRGYVPALFATPDELLEGGV